MRNRLICMLASLLMLVSGCAARTGAPSDDDYDDLIVVGFSQVGAESDWRNANTRSMQQALSAENGFRLIIDDAQQKKERQITAIRNFIHQGVDYIVLARNSHWTLAARDSGDFTQAKGQELVEAYLAQGIEFNVIFAENDNMAYGAIDALKNAGLTPGKDVTIVSFDADRKALEMVMAGEISFDVECNPLHGPRVCAVIEQLERGEIPSRFTFVEETAFSSDGLTQEIIDSRGEAGAARRLLD